MKEMETVRMFEAKRVFAYISVKKKKKINLSFEYLMNRS